MARTAPKGGGGREETSGSTTLVLAGTRAEFRRWFGGDPNARYASNTEAVRGLITGRLEVVGTFWRRPDARAIYVAALAAVRPHA